MFENRHCSSLLYTTSNTNTDASKEFVYGFTHAPHLATTEFTAVQVIPQQHQCVKFPYDSRLCGLWLKAICQVNADNTLWTPTDCNRVYSNLFLEKDFQTELFDGKK